MDQSKILRINELAAKAKTPEGLTQKEIEERAALRKEYIESVRANLMGQLNNTVIQYPDGSRKSWSGSRKRSWPGSGSSGRTRRTAGKWTPSENVDKIRIF